MSRGGGPPAPSVPPPVRVCSGFEHLSDGVGAGATTPDRAGRGADSSRLTAATADDKPIPLVRQCETPQSSPPLLASATPGCGVFVHVAERQTLRPSFVPPQAHRVPPGRLEGCMPKEGLPKLTWSNPPYSAPPCLGANHGSLRRQALAAKPRNWEARPGRSARGQRVADGT